MFASKRGHTCAPGLPLEVRLEELPPGQARAARAVLGAVGRRRGVTIEAVDVGIFVKRERTIIELRPKRRALAMSIVTARTIASPRTTREIPLARGTAYFFNLADEDDVDAEVRGWIRDALAPPR